MTYVSRSVSHKRAGLPRLTQIGVRIPADLAEALDAFCLERDVKRSEVVVAALRRHLGTPSPAETPVKREG